MRSMATTAAAGPGGKFNFDDGGSYVGDWSDGTAHGYGICTGPRGEGEFAGAWQHGFETSGVFRGGIAVSVNTGTSAVAAGPIYEGQWLQGRRHGLGIDSRGATGAPVGGPRWLYRGEWTQGFRGRYGVRQSTATGTKYEGTWTAGLQDGYGVETYADGGTYQGQWLRGVRHGYGIRQSVSYEVALRYPTHTATTVVSIPVPGSVPVEKEDDILLRERDFRIEESRGGFVLRARTVPAEHDSASGKHRMILDKHGRPSLRKTIVKELRMIRQRSTGDLHDSSSRSSSRMSGSVRSTSSQSSYTGSVGTATTGAGSVYSDEGSEASFVSQSDIPVDALGHELLERYLGEWKGDRRSGYGVAERTDGLRYEGEWASNRKHGYGVTVLRDGTRIEGKYKNNILVASVSGSKTSSKLFTLRSGKLRDRVDAAIRAAASAADMALQKAEIANTRMLSARLKSEQAEEVAKRASSDAEAARNKAREYSPGSSQPGSNIIANRPTQETELQSEFNNYAIDGYENAGQTATSSTKLFSFFKPKKSPSQQQLDASGIGAGFGGTLQSQYGSNQASPYQSASGNRGGMTPVQSPYGGPKTNGRSTASNNYGPRGGINGNDSDNFDRMQQTSYEQVSFSPNTLPSARRQWSDGGPAVFSQVSVGQGQGNADHHAQQQQQQQQYSNMVNYGNTSNRSGGGLVLGAETSAHVPYTTSPNNGVMTSSTTYAHGAGSFPDSQGSSTAQSRRAAMVQGGGQRSFDDRLPILSDRRNSLPSIVKTRADMTSSNSAVKTNDTRGRVTSSASTTTAAAVTSKRGGKVDPTSNNVVVRQKPQMDTFVIENGVRKRVRSIYDESSVGAASGAQQSAKDAIQKQHKLYALESPRRSDMGSVPNVSAISKDEVLPREVVSVLSQRRREELIRERENNERRQRNQIVFQLGDMVDWCGRRRMLVFLIAVNIGVAALFYNMLNQ